MLSELEKWEEANAELIKEVKRLKKQTVYVKFLSMAIIVLSCVMIAISLLRFNL
jgi:lipopolysaccharide/colanic/teichoic acid biosynthesis glycosyltransferase